MFELGVQFLATNEHECSRTEPVIGISDQTEDEREFVSLCVDSWPQFLFIRSARFRQNCGSASVEKTEHTCRKRYNSPSAATCRCRPLQSEALFIARRRK